ncbi:MULTISPECIES: crotonase/enoyl-CoA hydratase family protein [Gordonia]|uniref:Crotonase/enoyl-CoA hydratase family protein n=1 Tax=Gordonia amicalis TaxID=89053 RepID=A0AAE4R4R7_9ACTN|nr:MULTISPECIES: crotonase/enoyl-CoA hydratase family protein [Gordonia]ATD71172.1 enoyl-CoA hydratase [Gordonia sp. 1D]MCZ4579716.1 crotonase/enoyl-CoA hydratase family protein [Gordonia amicalis]MCZ4652292.1 crotonase/enoyl-CoA hydratase family protein [Gordonia amicalis]MDJ0453490.1 crotonase/enoyl-CoA hydratase family protein [Gordonia amicalis]MDV6308259.1 crotonase/enoyl-CoA hydratase family protein [Gordonia amicalis]
MTDQAWNDRDWTAFDVTVADHIAEVALTGPGKGNAMGPDFWRELPELFGYIDADPAVRAVVLTGAGKHFSYGLDLVAMGGTLANVLADNAKAAARTEFLEALRKLQAGITAVADCRKPVVAAISGWCIGGGVDLICAADIRYASADATFSIREVKVGMVADVGTLARLPFIIGDGHMRELALTGKDFDAARAEKIGLVNDVADDQEAALTLARETAREIADNPPLVVHGIKDVLDHSRSAAVHDSLRYVAAWNSAFLPSEDLSEAITAVFEKRKPEFKGR